MKKILVLALSGIMVLTMAAVSMAAVTVGGEGNFGYNFTGKQDFNDFKISATAKLNDEVTAFGALKAENTNGGNVGFDEAWVSFTEPFATVKVGHFAYNAKGGVDIVPVVFGDLKNQAGISVTAPLSENISINGYVGMPSENNTQYAVGVAAKFGALSGDVNYFEPKQANNDPGYVVNVGYQVMEPLKLYANYETQKQNGQDVKDTIVGAQLDSANLPVYGRLEYDTQKAGDDSNAWGARIGYKMGNGASIQYDRTQSFGNADTSTIKLNVVF
ncbi:MAG: porin [Bacillota bacterium]